MPPIITKTPPTDLGIFIPPKPTDIPPDADEARHIDWLGRMLDATRHRQWANAYWYAIELAQWYKGASDQMTASRLAQSYLDRWRAEQ